MNAMFSIGRTPEKASQYVYCAEPRLLRQYRRLANLDVSEVP
jgi:hypothetical protein